MHISTRLNFGKTMPEYVIICCEPICQVRYKFLTVCICLYMYMHIGLHKIIMDFDELAFVSMTLNSIWINFLD